VEEYLHRFPGGLPSFDLVGFYPGGSGIGVSSSLFLALGTASYATEKGAHSIALSPLDMGLEFTIPLDINVGLGVTGSIISYAPGSPEAALVGTGITCPRTQRRMVQLSGRIAPRRSREQHSRALHLLQG
jgi:hypothetical protein